MACCSLSRLFTMSPGLVLSVVVRFSRLLQCSSLLILVLLFFFYRKNRSFLDQFQFRRGIADQDGVHPTKWKSIKDGLQIKVLQDFMKIFSFKKKKEINNDNNNNNNDNNNYDNNNINNNNNNKLCLKIALLCLKIVSFQSK